VISVEGVAKAGDNYIKVSTYLSELRKDLNDPACQTNDFVCIGANAGLSVGGTSFSRDSSYWTEANYPGPLAGKTT
jgi:hypothetical protein